MDLEKRRRRVNALYTNLNSFTTTFGTGYRCPWCHRGMLEKRETIYHCPMCNKDGDVVSMAATAWGIDEDQALEDMEKEIPANAYYADEEPEKEEARPELPETINEVVYVCDTEEQAKAWEESGASVFSLEFCGLDWIFRILPGIGEKGYVKVRVYDEAQREALTKELDRVGVKYDTATAGQMDVWYFMHDIYTDRFKPIPTGFPGLDELMGGGFTAQTLVTLGGAPGVGKTSFVCSMLENMASNGRNVIYINLEMSKEQLLARTLSRITYQITSTGKERPVKLTQKETLMGQSQTKEQKEALKKAAVFYWEKIAPHFSVNPQVKGPGQSGILKAITAAAETAIGRGEEPPIVCVDYLQIVDFIDGDTRRYDAVEGMKKFINKLKAFAITYNTTVLLIIAHNRTSNAKGQATQESGRDSSAIEYSGDAMITLSFTAVEQQECSLEAIRLAIDGGELRPPAGVEDKSKEYKEYEQKAKELEVAKRRKDEITLKLVKGRMGERGRKELVFKGEASMFVEKGDKGETWDYTRGWKPTKETPFDTKK